MVKDKIVVITGANRGIGFETVKAFAAGGAIVCACARNESEDFEKALIDLANIHNTSIEPYYFDMLDKEKMKSVVKEVGRKYGRIDILVNNAGINAEQIFSMTSLDTIKNIMDTNCLAHISLSQMVSRYMIKNKKGAIVNVASVAGIRPENGGIAYGGSKAALIFDTKLMALELGKYGIRVNSVSPGFISTDMWGKRDTQIRDRIMSETPLERQGLPEEVALAILFLASDMSSYITGQNLVVDGGRNL